MTRLMWCSVSSTVTPRVADPRDEPVGLLDLGRRHPRRRLVEQQQARPARQRPGDLEPALLDQRELVGRPRRACRAEPDQVQQRRRRARIVSRSPAESSPRQAGAMAARKPPDVRQWRADHHVLDDGHLAEEPDVLEGPRDAARGDAVGPPARDVLSRRTRGARRSARSTPVTRLNSVVLPGAVRPDHRVDRARLDGQRDVGDGGEAAERLRQPARRRAPDALCGTRGMARGRGRPMRPHGRQIIMATSSVPKKVIRHSWITRSASGSSVTPTAPAHRAPEAPHAAQQHDDEDLRRSGGSRTGRSR